MQQLRSAKTRFVVFYITNTCFLKRKEPVLEKKISSNTDTKIGPWFRFPIPKPSFGHTLVCRHESLENLVANHIHILFSICLKDPIFFNCPLYQGLLFAISRLSVYCTAFWNVNDIRFPISDISSGLIMMFLSVRFFYYFWYVDIGTLENCYLLGISWQNVFFKIPTNILNCWEPLIILCRGVFRILILWVLRVDKIFI